MKVPRKILGGCAVWEFIVIVKIVIVMIVLVVVTMIIVINRVRGEHDRDIIRAHIRDRE